MVQDYLHAMFAVAMLLRVQGSSLVAYHMPRIRFSQSTLSLKSALFLQPSHHWIGDVFHDWPQYHRLYGLFTIAECSLEIVSVLETNTKHVK